MTDSIGLRVITRFIDDIYQIVTFLSKLPGVTLVQEKDYIRHAKPNGYRSLSCHPGQGGAVSGHRWQTAGPLLYRSAAANHRDGFVGESGASGSSIRKTSGTKSLIVKELKRCADEPGGL